MMEQKSVYFHLTVQGPSECQEREGCHSLCQASKWRNMIWRNWSWQAGKEKSLQPYLPCPVLLAGVGWRTESPSGGCSVLQPSPQSQVTACEALLVSLVSTLLCTSIWAPRADSPAAFSLLPVYSERLLDGRYFAGWRKEDVAAACLVGGTFWQVRLRTALSQKNIRRKNLVANIIRFFFLHFVDFCFQFVLDGCMCEHRFSGFRFNHKVQLKKKKCVCVGRERCD